MNLYGYKDNIFEDLFISNTIELNNYSLKEYVLKTENNSLKIKNNVGTDLFTFSNTHNSNKKLSINTTNSTNELEVGGDINYTGSLYKNNTLYQIYFTKKINNDLYNNNTGNIGIGITNPTTLLHIKKPNPSIFVANSSNSVGNSSTIQLGTTGNSVSGIKLISNSLSSDKNELVFKSLNNVGSQQDILKLNSDKSIDMYSDLNVDNTLITDILNDKVSIGGKTPEATLNLSTWYENNNKYAEIDTSGGVDGNNTNLTGTNIINLNHTRTSDGNIPPHFTYTQSYTSNNSTMVIQSFTKLGSGSVPDEMTRLVPVQNGDYRVSYSITFSGTTGTGIFESYITVNNSGKLGYATKSKTGSTDITINNSIILSLNTSNTYRLVVVGQGTYNANVGNITFESITTNNNTSFMKFNAEREWEFKPKFTGSGNQLWLCSNSTEDKNFSIVASENENKAPTATFTTSTTTNNQRVIFHEKLSIGSDSNNYELYVKGGNVKASGWIRGTLAGQHLNTQVYYPLVNDVTIPANQGYTSLFTAVTYSPVSSTSRLIIEMDGEYQFSTPSGTTEDNVYSRIYINNSATGAYRRNIHRIFNGGGGRAARLLPISINFFNSSLNNVTIELRIWTQNSNESVSFVDRGDKCFHIKVNEYSR